MNLLNLAADIRFMQFFAHNCHNLIKGETFFSDHAELGSIYSTYEGIYDSIIERAIGIGEEVDLTEVQISAVETLKKSKKPSEFTEAFKALLTYEKYICSEIEKGIDKHSEGTRQFLGNIADQSEMRQYKLKQRIG